MLNTKVYLASCTRHATKWKHLRWPGIKIISTWHDSFSHTDEQDHLLMRELWKRNLEQVKSCDVLICFQEDDDRLRGALVELGAALAWGKLVIYVGNQWSGGTHSSLCKISPNMQHALVIAAEHAS